MGSYPPVCESNNSRNKCRPNSRQSKSSERRPEFIAPPPPNCPPPPLAAPGQVYKEVYSGLSLPPPAAIASRYKKRQPTASIISNGHHQVNGHHVPNGHSRHQSSTEYSSKNSGHGYHDSEDLMQWNHNEPQVAQSKNNTKNVFSVRSSLNNDFFSLSTHSFQDHLLECIHQTRLPATTKGRFLPHYLHQ